MNEPHSKPVSERFPVSKPTVVVVDDDPDLLELVEGHLRAHGYAVEGFTDPVDALARLRGRPAADVAVVDCIMPHLTGAELCAALTEAGVEVPVVLMTALADPSFCVHLDRARVLSKPFLMEDLVLEIEAQLGPRSRTRGAGARSLAPAR
jgi:two-component system response regulator MprA